METCTQNVLARDWQHGRVRILIRTGRIPYLYIQDQPMSRPKGTVPLSFSIFLFSLSCSHLPHLPYESLSSNFTSIFPPPFPFAFLSDALINLPLHFSTSLGFGCPSPPLPSYPTRLIYTLASHIGKAETGIGIQQSLGVSQADRDYSPDNDFSFEVGMIFSLKPVH